MTDSQAPGRYLALLLEYDGSRYSGSQYQLNAPTVQAELETAISRTTGKTARVSFAGRTDAGVHARGQVGRFRTLSQLAPEVMLRAINAWLPQDIVVRAIAEVEPGFDPRRSALRRHYRYVIDNRPTRPALGRGLAWHVARPLDAAPMNEAASKILGSHDFRAFAGALENPDASTVRDLYSFTVARRDDTVFCDTLANAFLPHQVRRMIGALVQVGLGRLSVDGYADLLGGETASAGPAAPARGLYLIEVDYGRDLFGSCGLD